MFYIENLTIRNVHIPRLLENLETEYELSSREIRDLTTLNIVAFSPSS